jgi:pimeloyl-ACP methyl ester carboxylesterase
MPLHLLSGQPTAVVLIGFVLVVVAALAIAISALWRPVFAAGDLIRGDGKTLVVLLHGYKHSRNSLRDVQKVLSEQFPTADLMVPTFRSGIFSNARPEDVASELEASIDREFKARKTYGNIVLVGHSTGALLVRKAFVFGRGHTEDRAGYSSRSATNAWTEKVGRIVLLAGMNRGWSISTAPAKLGLASRVLFWAGKSVSRFTGTGLLIRGCERGAPFVANLRLQWLDLSRESLQGGRHLEVIQLLGLNDHIVLPEDSKDVAVSQNFIFIKIGQTGHGSIIKLRDRLQGQRRTQALRDALTEHIDVLRADNTEAPLQTNDSVERAIFIMHGIRDQGDWTKRLADSIRTVYVSKYGGKVAKLVTITPGYGYFPMLSFLLVSDRQKNVRWFVDKYTEIKAEFPKLREIDFVGHSNGTFILASALQRYQTLRVDRVIFAGSVVPQDYDWDDLITIQHRVKAVKNYVGSADWVVGIFPGMFQLVSEKLGIKAFGFGEIGSAGFNGFYSNATRPWEERFISGGHGAVVDDESQFPSISAFIIDGVNEFDFAKFGAKKKQCFVDLLSKLCWLVWSFLLLAVVSIGLVLALLGPIPLIVYIVVLIALLYTI